MSRIVLPSSPLNPKKAFPGLKSVSRRNISRQAKLSGSSSKFCKASMSRSMYTPPYCRIIKRRKMSEKCTTRWDEVRTDDVLNQSSRTEPLIVSNGLKCIRLMFE